MPKKHSKEIKQKVLELGLAGKTYSEIREIYPIPKATLSYWFKNIGRVPDRSRQLEHLVRARAKGLETIKKKKNERLAEAYSQAVSTASEIPLSNTSIQKALLAMLYWAEGGKQDCNFKFTNTDPVLILMFVSMLRNSYEIDESRFRIGLHVHYYHKHREVLAYWSELLCIPKSQFWRIYVKKRSMTGKRFRKNFMGICHVHYASSAIQRELLALGKIISRKL